MSAFQHAWPTRLGEWVNIQERWRVPGWRVPGWRVPGWRVPGYPGGGYPGGGYPGGGYPGGGYPGGGYPGGGSSSTGSTLSFPMASMGVSGNNGDSLVYTQAPGSCSGGLSSYLSSRGNTNNARFTSGVPMGGMPTHTVASPQAVGIPGGTHDLS